MMIVGTSGLWRRFNEAEQRLARSERSVGGSYGGREDEADYPAQSHDGATPSV